MLEFRTKNNSYEGGVWFTPCNKAMWEDYVGNDGGDSALELSLTLCDNPFCNCMTVYVGFKGAPTSSDETKRIALDLEKQDVSLSKSDEKNESSSKQQNLSLAKAFVSELSPRDWSDLRMWYYNVKNHMITNMDVGKIDVSLCRFDFPMKEIERNGEMVSFSDVFEGSYFIQCEYKVPEDENPRVLMIDDRYCVRSSCSCREALLIIMPVRLKEDGSGVPDPDNSHEIKLDLETGKYEVISTSAKVGKTPNEAMELFFKQSPKLLKDFEKRKKILCKLYKSYRENNKDMHPDLFIKETVQSVASRKSVSLNATCPCGSGKKYKRCCGIEKK